MSRFSWWSLGLATLAALSSRVHYVEAAVTKNAGSVSGHTYDYIIVGGGLAGLTVSSLPLPCASTRQQKK